MAAAKSLNPVVPSGQGTMSLGAPAASGPEVTVPPTPGTLPAVPVPLLATTVARPYTNVPDRLNGKVFFSDGVNDYACSGTVVNSSNQDMVDTAGHCVSDGAGTFYSDWIFVPAFSSSATACTTTVACAPYGVWTARNVTTTSEWHYFENIKQDYGYAVMNTLGGRHIASYLGGQGSRFNVSRTQTWTAFGYPQTPPFNGYDQKQCVSVHHSDDNPYAPYSPAPGSLTVGISCDQTGGSSGGGWLINLSSGMGYVNGHNSYGYASQPGVMYGPYYGADALALFNFTQATPGSFVSVSPARLLDTRNGTGAYPAPVEAYESVTVQITGGAGVPASGVSAVVVNLTVTEPTESGNITAYADGAVKPTVSNLNFVPGQTIPNLAVVPVGADGMIRLANNSTGTVNLIADVAGYYLSGAVTAPGGFVPKGPARVLDTRTKLGVAGPVGANASIAVPILGRGGVPIRGVSAVVVNLTVTAPTKAGNITAYADGAVKPGASNLNFVTGQTIPNLAVVPVGADGKIRLANNSTGTVQLIADVAGYYLSGAVTASGGFVPKAPARLLDTRTKLGVAGPVGPLASIAVPILGRGGVPIGGVSAVVLNLTVTVPTRTGSITAYADGAPRPLASNLNFVPGQSIPNLAVVPVGADGKIRLSNNSPGTVQLIADVSGYYLK